jgi:SAM-dependent methyltransferase
VVLVFSASAELYDLIYAGFKDYPAEAAQVARLIREANPGATRVLDVACGTAEHARLLTVDHGFMVDGLDLDPGFVRVARRKLPGASVHEADMMTFELPARYDVVLCLFSSIGYLRTLANVRRALERFRAHLADGGIVIVEPWFAPGVLKPGRILATVAEGKDTTVCRMSHLVIEGRLSRLHFEYLIGTPDGIERAAETHELGLFTVAEMLACFEAAGLQASYDATGVSGRGLYVAHT